MNDNNIIKPKEGSNSMWKAINRGFKRKGEKGCFWAKNGL